MNTELQLIDKDIEGYLDRYQRKQLLRFVVVGSVDDGKSTLMGRLLHDTGMVYEDQLAAVKRASSMEGAEIDFSLFTDGLIAEREQGITIDVAYRYFATEKRKFIIADTPGHVQYTRNMVTGASTADVALILIDARLGVLQQSRRHAYIASLLGIPHLAVCVNKMDLAGYAQETYQKICAEFTSFSSTLQFKDVQFFPVSALRGENVVTPSTNMDWHKGGTLLEYLERVPVAEDRNLENFRFPVQYVNRPNLDYRGYAGEVASGTVRKGDRITVLPSGKTSKIKAIDTYEGSIDGAFTQQSVTLRLEDEIDVSRGDMLVHPDDLPHVTRTFEAHVVWMNEKKLDLNKSYVIKHTTRTARAQFKQVQFKIDLDTLKEVSTPTLELNDIGRCTIACQRALYVDDYRKNRSTGAFIIIDTLSNNTVGAGMIIGPKSDASLKDAMAEAAAGSAMALGSEISATERVERARQQGAVVVVSAASAAESLVLAYALERKLFDMGHWAVVVSPKLSDAKLVVNQCAALADAGIVAICANSSVASQLAAELGKERVFQNMLDSAAKQSSVDELVSRIVEDLRQRKIILAE